MGKWREEVKVLPCGCKIGRSNNGLWFYDYICEKHLPCVQTNGKYDYEKALKFTEELNRRMRKKEKGGTGYGVDVVLVKREKIDLVIEEGKCDWCGIHGECLAIKIGDKKARICKACLKTQIEKMDLCCEQI